ncbi:Coproporphyrinogen-III oxidase [Sporothrix eucalyptigena]|uniref:Coproporphyrinogen-III oxidase n=1 Tax=Sporothrix eucalyptigena TaxID=1812306 RepID=A0ABP0CCW7_9PEZI
MDDHQASVLPAPRDLLAELIHAIASVPAKTDATSTTMAGDVTSRQTRPPTDQQPLLATLHVLFPSLVLPALDLLDRRRIVRWGEKRRQSSSSSSLPPPIYQIRGGSDRLYVVHLRAWHCACAFFALQAAASIPSTTNTDDETAREQPTRPLKKALARFPLAFSTPPCKHLLACLLAEEWAALDEYVVAGEDHIASGPDCTPETLAGLVAGVL